MAHFESLELPSGSHEKACSVRLFQSETRMRMAFELPEVTISYSCQQVKKQEYSTELTWDVLHIVQCYPVSSWSHHYEDVVDLHMYDSTYK